MKPNFDFLCASIVFRGRGLKVKLYNIIHRNENRNSTICVVYVVWKFSEKKNLTKTGLKNFQFFFEKKSRNSQNRTRCQKYFIFLVDRQSNSVSYIGAYLSSIVILESLPLTTLPISMKLDIMVNISNDQSLSKRCFAWLYKCDTWLILVVKSLSPSLTSLFVGQS